MKKIISYILVLIFGAVYAQKMAYVDTQYILKQMPQYQQSEQRLNEQVKKWQNEILNQQSKLEKLKLSFENEKVLLTDEQQKTKLSEMDSLESNLNKFIEKKFGTNGESTTLRFNLAKPLQDQIWNAINTISAKEKYNIIFDKSSDLIMVYTDSRYDITDKVLKQLGMESSKKDKKLSNNIGTNEDKEEVREEEVDENDAKKETKKPKSGYGSRYVPKKKAKEVEIEEDKEQEVEKSEKKAEKQKKETKKPKTGYGSRYVPKKEVKETKIEETVENVEVEKEIKKPKEVKKTEKPKTGYGSKYVPNK